MRNRLSVIWLVLLFTVALVSGGAYQKSLMKNSVAIRIGMPENDIDYDLMCAIDFMVYQLEKQGYYVAGKSYAGHLYPLALDDVKINVFVRAFRPFFDIRLTTQNKNVFYVQRFSHQYVEEFVGFDAYLTSQRNLQKIMKEHLGQKTMNFMPSGGVPRSLLKPNYAYQMLYIYEFLDERKVAYLQKMIKNVKIYGGAKFASLSQEEREKELARAKMVFYDTTNDGHDDADYVPFAVYDIIGYGRPVITSFNPVLYQTFGRDIYLYRSYQDLEIKIQQALQEKDEIREQKAQQARKVLRAADVRLPNFF